MEAYGMKKIVLMCSMGLSTSALVTKMKDAASKEGFDCEISAYPVSEASTRGKEADCILIGPQMRFSLNNVKGQCPGVPCEAIDTAAYGMMDGSKVLAQAKKAMGV